MTYVDGVVLPVPTANKADYIAHAKHWAAKFRALGATSVTECWQDDIPEGKTNSFHTAVLRKESEEIVFSWITWRNKEERDEAWAKLQNDPETKDITMPFDGSRMIYGGFKVVVEE